MNQFPPSSAARIMTENVPTAKPDDTVSSVLQHIKQQVPSFDSISYTYVVGSSGKLLGVVSIGSLLKAKDSQLVHDVMTKDIISVHPYTDQEHVAMLAIEHNIKAIPVIDRNDLFRGTVANDRILSILHEEHIEDILKLSGIDVSVIKSSEIKLKSTSSSLRMRIPWLLLGLFGGLITTLLVSQFEALIQEIIALSFFIPVVAYLSGAIANQTQSMLIRNVIVRGLNIKKYYFSELVSGTILGAFFGILLGVISYFWLKIPEISLTIAISMTINAALSTTTSTFIPWFLTKSNKDPAFAAGPFSIVIQDMMNIIVYLTTASIIFNLTNFSA